ncbi:MAG: ABC-ATPase UvrA, partial [Lachnospiraceae bacterium]|nr:ABC-ATPase UvrA [Lachnospiraceae bacterium]
MTQKNKTTSKQSARKILPADIHDYIRVRGAAENNLKHISVNIPRQTLTVLTGLSGSGKSSLAFNTIFAEGQRRYMESLSSYARMFLGQMEKPNVENIEGLSPTISIDQKTTNRNPRSTVGTVTEIYDHFRLLYARIGIPHCPNCGREIRRQSVDEMADQILQLETGTKLQILAPVVRGKKGRHEKVFERAKRAGYVRVRVDGSQYDLSEEIELDKNIKHSIEIIVDRLVIKEDRQSMRSRLTDSIESALALAAGLLVVDVIGGKELTFSQSFACPDCGISIPEIEPRSFSFNNPYGACPECSGLGYKMEFDEDLMVPDQRLSLNEGAIQVMGWQSSAKEGSFSHALLEALAKAYRFSLDEPYEKLPQKIRTMLMHGFDKTVMVHYVGQRGEGNYPILFDGLIKNVEQRYRETGSDAAKAEYEEFMRITPCKACGGQRLKKESLAVTISGKNIYEITNLAVGDLNAYLEGMELTKQQERIGVQVL